MEVLWNRLAWPVVLGMALMPGLLGGCKQSSSGAPAAASDAGAATASAGDVKTFPVRGKIVNVDTVKGSVLLNADAVPGFMGAMTMTYKLKDPTIVSELHRGDMITATLLVRKVGDDYEDPMLDSIVVTAQALPDYKPAIQYHVPTKGDAVPDFKLLNENGRTIHLGQFKGQVLLLTFIYTRCPLVDFCPRMSKNFAEIDKEISGDAKLYKQTHLLSISFDPKFDTPAVLKQYGRGYMGGGAREFAHWDFAAPPEHELSAVEQFFDVGVTPGEAGTLTHSLSTALIGKDGKVLAWYPTNEWTTAEVLAAMKSAAAA